MKAQGAALGLWCGQHQKPQRGGPNRAVVVRSVLKPPLRVAPLGLLGSVAFPTQGCALGCHRAAPLGLERNKTGIPETIKSKVKSTKLNTPVLTPFSSRNVVKSGTIFQ